MQGWLVALTAGHACLLTTHSDSFPNPQQQQRPDQLGSHQARRKGQRLCTATTLQPNPETCHCLSPVSQVPAAALFHTPGLSKAAAPYCEIAETVT